MKEPLAFRMRPKTLDDVMGQQHLVGTNGIIRKFLENNTLCSFILYGPPGVGKTTIASIIASSLKVRYTMLNATTSNKKDIQIAVEEAKIYGHIIVIMDEIHRLNKDKQDLLLPHLENGTITLIGTTTSNPYHAINPAIRSRCHLLELKPLTNKDIVDGLKRTIEKEYPGYTYEEEALEYIAAYSSGDVRFSLNNLELSLIASKNNYLDKETVSTNLKVPKYIMDKDGDGHYDIVSALQKSIRGSDVDAALYYLARMIESGDLDSLERRLLVTAYEDVGLGNPAAVARTIQAIDTAKKVGFPEGRIPLAVAVIDLALSPKSRSAEAAIDRAMNIVQQTSYDIPKYLKLTNSLPEADKYDYGRSDLWDKIEYLPHEIAKATFYSPESSGNYENALKENYLRLKKNQRTNNLRELKKHS